MKRGKGTYTEIKVKGFEVLTRYMGLVEAVEYREKMDNK